MLSVLKEAIFVCRMIKYSLYRCGCLTEKHIQKIKEVGLLCPQEDMSNLPNMDISDF